MKAIVYDAPRRFTNREIETPRALGYLESGKVKVDGLVSHEIPLQDYDKALELAWARQEIKIAIIP
jgi:threonine dehydrogenase-like Zn-dependent dehydrogenase